MSAEEVRGYFLSDLLLQIYGTLDDEEGTHQFYLIGHAGEMVTLDFDEDGDEAIDWREVPLC